MWIARYLYLSLYMYNFVACKWFENEMKFLQTTTYTNLKWNWIMSETMTRKVSRRCFVVFFFYFIIAAESVAETSEHGIQTNGEQRALNVVGIGFKPWIFLETIESAAKFIFIAKESLSLFSLNKWKKNASSADECARDFIWRWYPLTSAVASKRFTGIANYSSRLTAIVNIEPVGNNLH